MDARVCLQLVICLTFMVSTTNAKVKGYFQCTQQPHKEITCSTTNLPAVSNGSFDCSSNADVSKGVVCPLACDDGFYPASSNQTVCEAGKTNQGGEWSNGSFVCAAITCQEVDLPTVKAGYFNCSGYSVGDKCNLACDAGYYPSSSKEIVCKEYVGVEGKWSIGTFQCSEITCSTTILPAVPDGSFDCPYNTDVLEGVACPPACDYGFYPAFFNQIVCEAGTTNQGGEWSSESFVCAECNGWNEWNDTEYKFIASKYPWEESRQLCESESGHLVTIDSWEENNFIHKVVWHCAVQVDNAIWIGLNDRDTEGMWEWSDGTVFKYENWNEKQPDGNREQNCVRINKKSGKWRDRGCDRNHPAMCEKEKLQ